MRHRKLPCVSFIASIVKRYLPFAIVFLCAMFTFGGGMLLYRAKRPAPPTIARETAITDEKAESFHARGGTDALVTLEEFGDFQCPPCGALAGPLLQIEKDYGSKLRVVFRNFPFDIHQNAHAASFAAEAAGRQGRFWDMHDLLYREQAAWSKSPDAERLFESYAAMLRLDISRFKTNANSEEVKARVAADQKRGAELGVKNTPTIFINNHQLPPTSLNPDGVRKAIDEALAEVPKHP